MGMLECEDGMLRQEARELLVTMGKPAVSSLLKALQTSRSDQVRWEAAKALGAIGDARSIPALVKALEDNDYGVAWLAAQALRTFKKRAWPSLLRALVRDEANSVLLRQGTHHVLLGQKEDGCDDLLATLMKALEPSGVRESAIVAAGEILKRVKPKAWTLSYTPTMG